MSEYNYRPKGDISGDPKKIPDAGKRTGVTDTYGGNIEKGHNSSPISGSTKSDGMIEGGLKKNQR